QNDGRLAGLTVANDQLALATADRDQRVNGLEASGHRLVNRLARQDARSLDVDAATFGVIDRTLAVDRVAEAVDNAAEQARTNRSIHDGAGTLDDVAFLVRAFIAEDHDADIVGFEVQRHAHHGTRELNELTGLHVVEAVNAGNTVTDGEHLTD